LDVLLVGIGGDEEMNRKFIKRYGLDGIPYTLSRDLGHKYKVHSPPYALLINQHGLVLAKGVVNNLEHIESLLNVSRIWHPSRESLTLAEADGREIMAGNITWR
jgi:methylamine dehydrogenase accessory protein MauD